MQKIFHQLRDFENFEDRLATTITTRLKLTPNTDQIEAWKCRERADTFLRPEITDNNFSIELSASMARIILKGLDEPLEELVNYKKNGWELKDKRTGLTQTKAEELDGLKVLRGFSCQVDFLSFNYPSTRIRSLIWYAPALIRLDSEGYEYTQPDSGKPHINRIATKSIFENGTEANIAVLKESRQKSGALQRQKLKK